MKRLAIAALLLLAFTGCTPKPPAAGAGAGAIQGANLGVEAGRVAPPLQK